MDEGCPQQAHTHGVCVVAFSPCGHFFATGGTDSAVILWNVQTGNVEHFMQGHTGIVVALAFSAGGGKMASGSLDGSILLWDAKTGTFLRTINTHSGLVMDLHFSPTNSSKFQAHEHGRRRAAVGRWNRAAVQNIHGKVFLSIFSRRTHHRNGQEPIRPALARCGIWRIAAVPGWQREFCQRHLVVARRKQTRLVLL